MLTFKKLLTGVSFYSFFVFGFIDNLKGPLLPELFRNGDYNYSQGGTIVLAGYVGFILATLATGVMADVVSNRSVLLLASICLGVGSIGIGTSNSYGGLILFMGVTGIGMGAIELGANGLMIEVHSAARGRYLNFLATFHGFGSLLVPLYAAWMVNFGSTWQQIYCSSIFLVIPMFALFWLITRNRFIGDNQRADVLEAMPDRMRWDWQAVLRAGFTKRMSCFYVVIAGYVAVELSVAAWMMEFLQHDRGMSISASSIYLSSFFVLLMMGRLLGAFIVEKVDYIGAVFIAIVSSSLCLVGGIFGNDSLAVLLPISGFFMSIVFPTVTAAVARLHLGRSGTVLGILFACGGLGGALGPWTVGVVSDWAGLKVGMASSLTFALIALGALFCLKDKVR